MFFVYAYGVMAAIFNLLWLVELVSGDNSAKRTALFAASIALAAMSQIAWIRRNER